MRAASCRSLVLVTLLMASGCGQSECSCPAPPPTSAVTAIQILPATDSLRVGETVAYSVKPTISGLPPTGPPPGWSSSNTLVATVDPIGQVTGLSAGETTIKVVFFGLSQSRLVRVLP